MKTTTMTGNPLPAQLEVRARRDELQANLTNLRGQRDAERERVRGVEGGTSPELRAVETAIKAVEVLVDQLDQRLAALDLE